MTWNQLNVSSSDILPVFPTLEQSSCVGASLKFIYTFFHLQDMSFQTRFSTLIRGFKFEESLILNETSWQEKKTTKSGCQ